MRKMFRPARDKERVNRQEDRTNDLVGSCTVFMLTIVRVIYLNWYDMIYLTAIW
jgi:hypothetical protein